MAAVRPSAAPQASADLADLSLPRSPESVPGQPRSHVKISEAVTAQESAANVPAPEPDQESKRSPGVIKKASAVRRSDIRADALGVADSFRG